MSESWIDAAGAASPRPSETRTQARRPVIRRVALVTGVISLATYGAFVRVGALGLAAADDDACVATGYVGSDACASCHAKEFGEWKATLHSHMEQPATATTVIGAFTPEGTVVKTADERKHVVAFRRGDKFVVEAPDAEGKPHEYEIERTVGNRYKQRYLTKFPDGSWHTTPLQWNQKDHRFVEWKGLASGVPGSGKFWGDPQWQWQLKCAGCHTTGLDLGYDATAKHYDTKWKELAIGCESCHGPGGTHVNAKGGKDNVLCPSKFSHDLQLDTCGKCHSRGTAGPEQGAPLGLPGKIAYPYNYVPGTPLEKAFVQLTPKGDAEDFWPDESSKNHHQQWNDYRRSPMLHKGGDKSPTCTTCHDPHRADALKAPIENNALCIQCHKPLAEPTALAKHTGHGGDPLANVGARCVECHMPRIVDHAGSYKLRSHTYWALLPRQTRDTKVPTSCALCHKDKDATWIDAAADKIWPPPAPAAPTGTPK